MSYDIHSEFVKNDIWRMLMAKLLKKLVKAALFLLIIAVAGCAFFTFQEKRNILPA